MNKEKINYYIQKKCRAIIKKYLELKAFYSGKRFYCAALSGESSYNICINSDMSVSCNCQDYDGSGHIGNLQNQSLEEIFSSPKARSFRKILSSGKLPIHVCASCPELRSVDSDEAHYRSENWKICTEGIMAENTAVCPYKCTVCYRSILFKNRKATCMTFDDIRKVAKILCENKIKKLYFFNLGETFSVPVVNDQLRIIKELNPDLYISISTNGYLLDSDEKRKAALLADYIVFSIHGIDDETLNKYQHGASFDKAYGNMKKLADYRSIIKKSNTIIEWKYIVFNWNDKEPVILKAIELAKNAGVDVISFWPTFSPIYGVSWRYILKSFYKNMGQPSYRGRKLYLN